jgi:hypothetical protein
VVQSVVEQVFQVHSIDPLEATIIHSLAIPNIEQGCECIDVDIIEAIHSLEALKPYPSKNLPPFEMLCLLILLLFLLLSRHQNWN